MEIFVDVLSWVTEFCGIFWNLEECCEFKGIFPGINRFATILI